MKTKTKNRFMPFAFAVLFGGLSAEAEAAKIGNPSYDMSIWGILPGAQTHPLNEAGGYTALGYATEKNAVNGQIALRGVVGTQSFGGESTVHAGVLNGGDTFYIMADTPNNYRKSFDYIGSAAQVNIYQSYSKDSEDAKLTYTYSFAYLHAYVNPEFGPGCPLGDKFCMTAGMFSDVRVYDAANLLVDTHTDNAMINVAGSGPEFFRADTLGDWPWAIDNNPDFPPGTIATTVDIPHAVTREVDLSGIDLGEEFTVIYQLYGYAFDRGSDLGLNRGTFVSARDPLAGNTGVSFDITGLTPTNNPYIPSSIPLPAAFWLFASGMLALLSVGRRHG